MLSIFTSHFDVAPVVVVVAVTTFSMFHIVDNVEAGSNCNSKRNYIQKSGFLRVKAVRYFSKASIINVS